MGNSVASMSESLSSALDTLALQAVWSDLHFESCPYEFNFHLHTTCSDGQLNPISLIEQAIEIGLQGLAITDHHSVRGFYRARDWLDSVRRDRAEADLPHLWTGVEITAFLLDTEVHILGYGFDPEREVLADYLQGERPVGDRAFAGRVIDALHEAGGLVVLAHPERYRRPAEELIPVATELGIDGVEAFYAYGNPKPWQPSDRQTARVSELGDRFNLYKTCGTDTHGSSLLSRL